MDITRRTNLSRGGGAAALIGLAVILSALIGLAEPVRATEPQARPGYFSVSGVRQGQQLNIHSGPAAGAPRIGGLAHDATPVEVLERRGIWARIVHGEQDGWVSARFLIDADPPMQSVAAGLPVGLACYGAEPDWSLTFGDGEVEYRNGPHFIEYAIPHAAVAEGALDAPVALTLLGISASAVAVLRHGACTDGMSDATLGWSVDLLTQARGQAVLFSGCCRLPLSPSPATE